MCNTMYISSVDIQDDMIVLIPNREIKNITNCGTYRLIICCNAVASSNLPVGIQVGDLVIPVLCKAGNTMYANQLEKRKNYEIIYGNDNDNYEEGQIVVQNRVCPKSSLPVTSL